jgi:hypothetical protein
MYLPDHLLLTPRLKERFIFVDFCVKSRTRPPERPFCEGERYPGYCCERKTERESGTPAGLPPGSKRYTDSLTGTKDRATQESEQQ